MKTLISGFLVGAVLAAAGTAYATSSSLFRLRSGDQVLFQDVRCVATPEHAVACVLSGRMGYSVAISRARILVLDAAGKRAFYRVQP